MDFVVNSNHSCEVSPHVLTSLSHHNCSIRKCDTEGEGLEYLTTYTAVGKQRVDTQLVDTQLVRGGRESRSEDLEALSPNVHWKLEHLQSRMNTAYH